jgi:hypothetical protein
MALSAEERREARREYERAWRKANPEKVNAKAERYRAAHRTKLSERVSLWNRQNPDAKRAWEARNKDRIRGYVLARKYGMSHEDWKTMWDNQGGRCAICSEPMVGGSGGACVDHCHTSGAVRSLLCTPCNTAIGLLKEDPDRIKAAAEYVAKHQERCGATLKATQQ